MANKAFEMYEYRQIIIQMKLGESDRAIAERKLAGRRKCQELRKIATEQGWLLPESDLPDDATIAKALKKKAPVPQTTSRVESYTEQVRQWHAQGLNQIVIHRALVQQYNYPGSYHSVHRFIKKLSKTVKATVPLDYAPGEAAQVDFGKGPTLVNQATGEVQKTWFFVMTLCFSRHMYVEIIFHQTVEVWLGCHQRAFAFFGGVPHKIIIDNAKCAITRACYHDPTIQKAYAECAEGYGFIISPCPIRQPQMKGRVESGVKYVKNNFLPLRTFRSLADANQQLKAWVLQEAGQRTHGSTYEKPLTLFTQTERGFLKALPATPPELAVWVKAKVHGDCHVQYLKCRYSAPYQYVHQVIWLRVSEKVVRLYKDHTLLAMHARVFTPGQRQTLREHLPENAQAYLMRDPAWCRTQASRIGPYCQEVIERLFSDKVLDNLRAVQGILGLAKVYGDKRLELACQRTLAFNSLRYKTIKTILKEGLDYALLPEQESFDALGKAYTQGRFIRTSERKH